MHQLRSLLRSHRVDGGWWKQSNPTTGVWKSFSHCKQFYPHSRTIYFYPTTMDNNQFVVVVAVILIQKCLILFSLFAAFFVLQICIPICHFQFSIYPFQLSLPKEKAQRKQLLHRLPRPSLLLSIFLNFF